MPTEDQDLATREKEWLRSAREGNVADFGHVVTLHQPRLAAFAARWVPCAADVADIVQDSFIAAFRNLRSYDPERDFGIWLRAICRNRVMDHFRARKVRRTVPLAIVDDALVETLAAAREEADDGGRLQRLRECLRRLGPDQRTLVEARYLHGQALKDLAGQQGQTPAALGMRMMRLRDALRRCVEGKDAS